jgi:hypothetical protein
MVYAVAGSTGTGATAPSTPQNLRVLALQVESPRTALLTLAWDPSPGATVYEVGHVGPWGLWHRAIEDVTSTQATIGTREPFIVAPGQPYTVYVRAGLKTPSEILWSVPAVLEVQVPPYQAPVPGLPAPYAEVQGLLVGDSVLVPLLVGAPGKDLSHVRETLFVVDTGAFETALDAEAAQALGLPNLGSAQVQGVGGSAQAYNTKLDVQWANGRRDTLNAVVIPGFGQNLWGLRYAVDRKLTIMLSTTTPPVLRYYQL